VLAAVAVPRGVRVPAGSLRGVRVPAGSLCGVCVFGRFAVRRLCLRAVRCAASVSPGGSLRGVCVFGRFAVRRLCLRAVRCAASVSPGGSLCGVCVSGRFAARRLCLRAVRCAASASPVARCARPAAPAGPGGLPIHAMGLSVDLSLEECRSRLLARAGLPSPARGAGRRRSGSRPLVPNVLWIPPVGLRSFAGPGCAELGLVAAFPPFTSMAASRADVAGAGGRLTRGEAAVSASRADVAGAGGRLTRGEAAVSASRADVAGAGGCFGRLEATMCASRSGISADGWPLSRCGPANSADPAHPGGLPEDSVADGAGVGVKGCGWSASVDNPRGGTGGWVRAGER
jgi:hypothetical protein